MNLLLFNLRTDADDTSLGFTTSWIKLLAAHFARVFVVTMHVGRLEVPSNVSVYSISEGRDSRLSKLAGFYRLVWRLTSQERIDVCFSHMSPLLAVLFSPLAKRRRIPILLWYAHGSVPLDLRLAHRFVDRCVTSTPLGFRLPSRKLFVLSQGIDVDRFLPPSTRPPGYDQTIVCVSRLTPRKNVDQTIEAVRLVREDGVLGVRALVVGSPLTLRDREYVEHLQAQIAESGLGEVVELRGPLPFDRVHEVYRLGSIFVNLSETDSLDKAILEGMACGCIPVSRNRSFVRIARAEGLADLVAGTNAESVASAIRGVIDLPEPEKDALRDRLRGLVVRNHSLKGLIEQVVYHLDELARSASCRAAGRLARENGRS